MKFCIYTKLKEYLQEHIAGNEDVIHHLCLAFDLHIKKLDMIVNDVHPQHLPQFSLFITGATGTGKTESVKLAAQEVGLPYYRIDCSSLSARGWAGVDLTDHLGNYRTLCRTAQHELNLGDGSSLYCGVILLDEFDKLGVKVASASGDCPSESIQANLLDLLDGELSSAYGAYPLVIAAGSLQKVRYQKAQEKATIGFISSPKTTQEDWLKLLVEHGIMPELANRFTDCTETTKLTKAQIREVIISKKDSFCTKYRAILPGFELKKAQITELTEKVYNSDNGMRILNTEIYRLISEHYKTFYGGRKL